MALPDQTVIPGLVGMHEHLFYPSGGAVPLYIEHGMSFPRLYLASGVTTARTAGTLEPYTDLNLKKMIDQGRMPGPKMLITVGYLEGHGSFAPQMAELDTSRRRPPVRGVLGRPGGAFFQGVHAHHARRAGSRAHFRPRARPEDHRAFVLGGISRSGGARNR